MNTLEVLVLTCEVGQGSVLERLSISGNFFLPWQPYDEEGYGRFNDDVNDMHDDDADDNEDVLFFHHQVLLEVVWLSFSPPPPGFLTSSHLVLPSS